MSAVPHFEAFEVDFVVEEGRPGAVDDGRVRGQLLGRGQNDPGQKGLIIAAVLQFPGRLRQCMTFVNKTCSHMMLRDVIAARLLQVFKKI